MRSIKVYTDYPIFGRKSYDGTIREVEVVGYDGNKYAMVIFDGEYYDIKWGYLYRTKDEVGGSYSIGSRYLSKYFIPSDFSEFPTPRNDQ